MKVKNSSEDKHGCCHPESETRSSRLSKVLSIIPSSSTINTSHSTFSPLGNEERKAAEAYKLQVELRRSMAIEYARRNTIR